LDCTTLYSSSSTGRPRAGVSRQQNRRVRQPIHAIECTRDVRRTFVVTWRPSAPTLVHVGYTEAGSKPRPATREGRFTGISMCAC
jgi:hypothetical protein